MSRVSAFFATLLLLLPIVVRSDDDVAPRTFVFARPALVALKRRLDENRTRGDEMQSYRHLIQRADSVMTKGPFSVMTKPMTPPSGDKHDYESLATYYWPCNNATFTPGPHCNLTTGLPWVGRDGHKNPYGNQFDKVPMDSMITAAQALSAAYYYSGNETYAERAALLIRTWFLDASTLMYPNLNYSSIRPGVDNGSSSGVIDIHDLWIVIESVGILNGSEAWTEVDQSQLIGWFGELLHWLLHSPYGQGADLKLNNHGTWSDVVRSSFALFTGQSDVAQKIADGVPDKRIKIQIEPTGQMPLEENRTNAASYSCMNLRALFNLADLASYSGIELFNYTTPDGCSIRRAFEFMIPYALGKQSWPFDEINKNFSWGSMIDLFRRAANAYQSAEYEQMISLLPKPNRNFFESVGLPDEDDKYFTNMLYPKQFYD